MSGVIGVTIGQLLGDIEIHMVFISAFIIVAELTLIETLFLFGIRVHNESNNSYPILIKCIQSYKSNPNSFVVKMKVKIFVHSNN